MKIERIKGVFVRMLMLVGLCIIPLVCNSCIGMLLRAAELRREHPCPQCDGTGEGERGELLGSYAVWESCPTCGGTGIHPSYKPY